MTAAAPRIHPLIPLALLEALQNIDTPYGDDLHEIADELIARRFGLSETVATQVAQYAHRARRGRGVDDAEAVALFALLARRPDQDLLFADAGRRAARRAVRAVFPRGRLVPRLAPGGLGRRVGFGMARGVARRVFGATARRDGMVPTFTLVAPLSVRATGDARGCAFYGAAFAELLRLLARYEGALQHVECRARGAETCRWIGAIPSELMQ